MEDRINEILTGRRVVYTQLDDTPLVLCRGLTGVEKVIASIYYKKALDEAKALGLPHEVDLLKTLEQNGDWGPKYENKIKNLEGEIKLVSNKLVTTKYQMAQKRTLLRKLDSLKEKLDFLQRQRGSLISNSAESYANEFRYFWNLHKMTFKEDGGALWSNYEQFLNEDRERLHIILGEYIRQFILDVAEIRKIARSGIWRVYFNSCKNSSDLFNKPLCDLDANQLTILYWSYVYDNAFNAYEPPEDDIVDNDELFDAWLEEYAEKQKKERAKAKIDKGMPKGKTGVQQVFMMTDDEGAKQLYSDVGGTEVGV